MNTSDNNGNQDGLRSIWEASDSYIHHKYHLNTKDMENILANESTSFFSKFRVSLYFDIVFKCLMLAGLIILWTMNPSNLLVAGTTILLAVLNGLMIARLAGVLKAGRSGSDFTKSTAETLRASIGFYSGQSSVLPLSGGLSAGTFYILGSFLYHYLKYGIIKPFQDIQDIVVLSLFMFAAIAIAFISHYVVTRDQFRSLSKLVADVEHEDGFLKGYKRYEKAKTNRYLIGLVIAVTGVVLMVSLVYVFFFRQ